MDTKQKIETTAVDVKATIKEIKKALKERTGMNWSVTNSRGTAWGWLTITCPPARCERFGEMPEKDRTILASALGLERVHSQGESIPSGRYFRQVYLARAMTGSTLGYTAESYWD